MPDATVLFELEQLASYVQSDLDEATATLARDLATGVVQEEIAQRIFRTTSTTRLPRHPIDPSVLVLPQVPVDPNEPITAVGIDHGAYDADAWTLVGQRLVLDQAWFAPRENPAAPRGRAGWGAWDEQVDVTYTHGFSVIPRLIQSVALACAARVVANPTGVRQTSVGDVSVTYAGSDADLTSGAYLTDRERAILRRFRAPREPMVAVR